jgi:transposase-like protein
MGTSPERVMTDKLGCRSGPRRKYSIAEKRSMVEETRQPGASVLTEERSRAYPPSSPRHRPQD